MGSVLLDSKVANPNVLNKAGYTCIMLISLAQIINDTHRAVISRLFEVGDVNLRASQHGQTVLMLAVSHGRLDMVKILVDFFVVCQQQKDQREKEDICTIYRSIAWIQYAKKVRVVRFPLFFWFEMISHIKALSKSTKYMSCT